CSILKSPRRGAGVAEVPYPGKRAAADIRPLGARACGRAVANFAPYVVNPLSEQRLDLGTQRWGDVVALQRICNIGGKKADLAAAIEAAAFELEPVKRLLAREPDHRIGDLDFAAGAL